MMNSITMYLKIFQDHNRFDSFDFLEKAWTRLLRDVRSTSNSVAEILQINSPLISYINSLPRYYETIRPNLDESFYIFQDQLKIKAKVR